MPHDTHSQGVDQRISLIDGIEDGFAADVRQAQGIAVVADAGDHAVDDTGGVRMVDGSEPQLIHHSDRARTHGDDVADDAADSGGRTLMGFDVAGVVVGFDLEGHGPAVPDVDHAGVLADAHKQVLLHVLGDFVTELGQVDLRGLVRAVLGPHHRIHGQFRRGGATSEDRLDLLVFVGRETEIGERLLDVGVRRCELDRLLDLLRCILRGIDLRGIRRAEVRRHVLFGALSYDTALDANPSRGRPDGAKRVHDGPPRRR
jgi:hypothetical protein